MKWLFLSLGKEKHLFIPQSLIHALLIAAVWHNLTKKTRTNSTFSPALSDTPKNYASLWLSTSRATICSPLLSPPWLPAACGHNTAHRHCSTQCTVVRTTTGPAGSSPSSSQTLGQPRERSRLGRKSVWRGHWLLSGLTLPERTEVGPMPNTQAQVRACASMDTHTKVVHIDIVWLLLDSLSKDAVPVSWSFQLITAEKLITLSN